jgi:hypothetical protein
MSVQSEQPLLDYMLGHPGSASSEQQHLDLCVRVCMRVCVFVCVCVCVKESQ